MLDVPGVEAEAAAEPATAPTRERPLRRKRAAPVRPAAVEPDAAGEPAMVAEAVTDLPVERPRPAPASRTRTGARTATPRPAPAARRMPAKPEPSDGPVIAFGDHTPRFLLRPVPLAALKIKPGDMVDDRRDGAA